MGDSPTISLQAESRHLFNTVQTDFEADPALAGHRHFSIIEHMRTSWEYMFEHSTVAGASGPGVWC